MIGWMQPRVMRFAGQLAGNRKREIIEDAEATGTKKGRAIAPTFFYLFSKWLARHKVKESERPQHPYVADVGEPCG